MEKTLFHAKKCLSHMENPAIRDEKLFIQVVDRFFCVENPFIGKGKGVFHTD